MAFTNTDTWIARHSHLLSRDNITSSKDAINADIKEAGLTVLAKRPVQQSKEKLLHCLYPEVCRCRTNAVECAIDVCQYQNKSSAFVIC
jgi:hypothetical protein